MRNPKDPNWPKRGERTELREIAERWRWAYYDWVQGTHRRRVLELPKEDTLGAAIEGFLEFARNTMEPNTHAGHVTAMNYLRDNFRTGQPLHAIHHDDVQAILDDLARQGYAASTMSQYRGSWNRLLRWANAEGLWGELSVREPGRVDVETLEPLEVAKLRKAADALDRSDPGRDYRLAIELPLNTGVRRGELFALQWSGFDAENKSVRINQQVTHRREELKPLKGKQARTALVLPGWWAHHRPGGTGFVMGEGVRAISSRQRDEMIQRVLDKAGLNRQGRSWHLLRHQYARHFLEAGGRIQELQKSLGHSSVLTTERYYSRWSDDAAVRLARGRIYGTG